MCGGFLYSPIKYLLLIIIDLTQVAEKLYQQGFVSYPRTETDEFDPQFDHMALINKQTADPAWGAFAASLGSSQSFSNLQIYS